MITKEQRKAEFIKLMEATSDLECTLLAGNPDGINARLMKLASKPNDGIHICTYCECWWHDGELPKHDSGCKRQNQEP